MKRITCQILLKRFFPGTIGIAILDVIVVLNRGVIFSYLSKEILESLANDTAHTLTYSSVLLFFVLCLASMSAAISKYMRTKLVCQATKNMEDTIWDRYALAENRREYTTETMLGYLSSTATKASGETLEYILNVSKMCLSIITTAVYACILSPLLLMVILSVTAVIIFLMRREIERLPKLYETFFEHLRVLDAKLWEQVKNHEAAGFLNLAHVMKGYEDRNTAFLHDLIEIKKIDNKVQFARKYGPLLLLILIVLCGGLLCQFGSISIAEIYAILMMIPTLSGSLLSLPATLADRKKYSAAHQLLDAFFTSAQESLGSQPLGESIHSIEFQGVCFSYPDAQKPTVQDISLSFGPGFHCLSGPSGSGKSTLLLLLLRILHAHKGDIRLNGQSILSYNREELYSHIGYVGQTIAIYQGSLLENIIQNLEYDAQKFRSLLETLHLLEWVNSLPEKENTTIDAGTLSSGEKQKVALARALYRNTELLILDEATAQMDPASEQLFILALKQYAHNKNRIVIYTAHRETSIQAADRLIRMENGQIIS